MNSLNLFEILATVREEEWIDLKKYIRGYLLPETDSGSIFTFLMKYKNKWDKLPPNEVIVEKNFPHLTAKGFLNHLSVLTKYVNDWLVLQHIKESPYGYSTTLYATYNKRGVYELADTLEDKLKTELDAETKLSLEYQKARFDLSFNGFFSNNPKPKKRGVQGLQEAVDAFITHTAETAAQINLELLNWGKLRRHEYGDDIKKLDAIIALATSNEIIDDFTSLRMVFTDHDSKKYYTIVKKLLNGCYQENRFLHVLITEYCIVFGRRLLFEQVIRDKQIVIEVYQYALTHGIFEMYGRISSTNYLNIVHFISTIMEEKKALAFAHQWIEKVQTKYREGTIALASAHIYFANEKYTMIRRIMWRNDFETTNQQAQAYGYHLIDCFLNRKKEPEVFLLHLSKYENFVKRNSMKMSESVHKSLIHLVQFLKDLHHGIVYNELPYAPIMFRTWCGKQLVIEGRNC